MAFRERERVTKAEREADSFVKSLTDIRDTLDGAIDEVEKSDHEVGLDYFNQAQTRMRRARRHAERVADAFDDTPPRRERE